MALLPVALMAGICGVYVESRALAMLAAIGMILALGLVWPWVAMRPIRGRLRFETLRVQEGERVYARLNVHNRSPLPVWGLLLKTGPRLPSTFKMTDVVGLARREFSLTLWPERRGEYRSDAFALVTGFPFGIIEAQRTLEAGEALIVWPRTVAVTGVPDVSAGAHLEGPLPSERSGTSGDINGVRPYRRGDSIRRIHWAQTARHDQLIVCERQSTRRVAVHILLDLNPLVHSYFATDSQIDSVAASSTSLDRSILDRSISTATTVPAKGVREIAAGVHPSLQQPDTETGMRDRESRLQSTREWAIRVAASLYSAWSAQGITLTLFCNDVPGTVTSLSGAADSVLDALARIGDQGDTLSFLMAHCNHHAGHGDALRVLITTGKALGTATETGRNDPHTLRVVLDPEAVEGHSHSPETIYLTTAEEIPARMLAGWHI